MWSTQPHKMRSLKVRQAGHQNPLQDWTLLLGETLCLKGTRAGQVNKWKQAGKITAVTRCHCFLPWLLRRWVRLLQVGLRGGRENSIMSYYYLIGQKKVNNQYNINNLKTGQYNTISIVLTPCIDQYNTILLTNSDVDWLRHLRDGR